MTKLLLTFILLSLIALGSSLKHVRSETGREVTTSPASKQAPTSPTGTSGSKTSPEKDENGKTNGRTNGKTKKEQPTPESVSSGSPSTSSSAVSQSKSITFVCYSTGAVVKPASQQSCTDATSCAAAQARIDSNCKGVVRKYQN